MQVGSPYDGITALRRIQRACFSLLFTMRAYQKSAICNLEGGPHQNLTMLVLLGLPVSTTVRNKWLLVVAQFMLLCYSGPN
jgi:hypothetical protein